MLGIKDAIYIAGYSNQERIAILTEEFLIIMDYSRTVFGNYTLALDKSVYSCDQVSFGINSSYIFVFC